MKVTRSELIRETARVHGVTWTARKYRRTIPFSLFYWLMFGCAPRKLRSMPVATF